jgi:signal peptidase I
VENSKKNDKKIRNEKEGLLNFSKEMISALLTAFVFIVYVIQAFTIPTGSMEKSLLVGDFLLGVKFIYGAPVLPNIPFVWENFWKFPGFTDPKRGDVVIFKYPGGEKKDYIKRCVAVAGDSVEIDVKKLMVNGKELIAPPNARWEHGGNLRSGIKDFKKLYIPKKGDTIDVANAPLREFIFYKHLVHQEYPYSKVNDKYRLLMNGNDYSDSSVSLKTQYGDFVEGIFSLIDFDKLDKSSDWKHYADYFDWFSQGFSSENDVKIEKKLFLDGQEISQYVCKYDNYFMMGDNRDNSADSRYWGFVNRNFIKAKALIIYFSLKSEVPLYLLPIKIRWERLGKLIRYWDGE